MGTTAKYELDHDMALIVSDDGPWLEIRSGGKSACINLANRFERGGIIEATFTEWAEQRFQERPKKCPMCGETVECPDNGEDGCGHPLCEARSAS